MLELLVEVTSGFLPEWNSDLGNAGLDLKAACDMTIPSNGTIVIPLGIKTAFANLYVAIIKDRSGLSSKHGLFTHAGVIDSNYRGEWGVTIENSTIDAYTVCRGDRIAQVIFLPCFHLRICKTDFLPSSERGEKGYGASGK
jgi:dUTP pyrophosphatase